MKALFAIAIIAATANVAGATEAHVVHDERGYKLQVDGKDLMVRGMNWGYTPIGSNYSYSLWAQSDEFVERVLRRDMELLRGMGFKDVLDLDGGISAWKEAGAPVVK